MPCRKSGSDSVRPATPGGAQSATPPSVLRSGAHMQSLSPRYAVSASASSVGDIELAAPRVAHLASASPAEFDGPGDRWSPETLLVGAVGDCFVLTFRAIARASKVAWTALECEVIGTLDRVDRVTQFTG